MTTTPAIESNGAGKTTAVKIDPPHGHASRVDRYALGVVKSKGMVGRYLDLDLDVHAAPADRDG